MWVSTFLAGFICVPFLTLLERKILAYIQLRKGPKKVSFMGILQPIGDGVKLLSKSWGFPSFSKVHSFMLFPFFSFILMLMVWYSLPLFKASYSLCLGILLVIVVSSMNVYSLMGSSWSSNSKYSLLGGLRGAAQSVSYEVSFIFIMFAPSLCYFGYSLNLSLENYKFLTMLFPFIFFVWLVSFMAESKRAPLDFAEGESELVSGFNTEYSSLPFTFLFLSEYGFMTFFSCLTCIFFFMSASKFYLGVLSALLGVMVMSGVVWMRGSFPRFRYDFLMSFCWKVILPLSMYLPLLLYVLLA